MPPGLGLGKGSGDDAENVEFLGDQQVLPADLDLGAGAFTERHAIAGLDVQWNELARLVAAAGADRNNFAFLRFFLGRIGMMMPAAVFSSLIRRITTRSCKGLDPMTYLHC